MIKIKIHDNSETNAQGTSTRGNRKPIYCITTGMTFSSQSDAANALGVHPSTMSWVATDRMKTVNGLRFCPLSAVLDHFDEIAETTRIMAQKATAYDAIIAEQEKETRRREEEQKARAELETRRANCEKLRAKLEREMQIIAAAEEALNNFMN